ncbi:O-antigen ligase family protein [Roseomonas elaeocarpi]|uniref:O-antigen ligase family protein n=1 Tax=Roseomonas elaeocarpi TaxID=907779 RepID=A0ABV6JSC4_9PROT
MTALRWRSAAFPVAAAALLAPAAAVLQSKAMAPLALVCLALSVLASRRATGRWPWPDGRMLWGWLALAALGLASSLWAPEPGRSVATGLQFLAIVLLSVAAARAVAPEDGGAVGTALFWGLLLGLGLALLDAVTGNAVRLLVRGLPAARPDIEFGLKPAGSVAALLLPLLVATPFPRPVRLAALAACVLAVVLLPGDTAKIAALLGAAVAVLARRLRLRRLIAAGLVAGFLIAPFLGAMLGRPSVVAHLPISAVHRILIWDFAHQRAAERPLLGWGLEASRVIPGGHGGVPAENLDRIGETRPEARAFFARDDVELLPLHPHDGPLQLQLELGWVGLLLATMLVAALALRAPGPAALGVLASGAVTFLFSFGVWQPWWLATQGLAFALVASLEKRA